MKAVTNMVNTMSAKLGGLLYPCTRFTEIVSPAERDSNNSTEDSGDSDTFYEVETAPEEDFDFHFDLDLERQAVLYNMEHLGSPFKSFDSLRLDRPHIAEKYGYILKSLPDSLGFDVYSIQDREEVLFANRRLEY